jgi:hypothetical protein
MNEVPFGYKDLINNDDLPKKSLTNFNHFFKNKDLYSTTAETINKTTDKPPRKKLSIEKFAAIIGIIIGSIGIYEFIIKTFF